MDPSTESPQTDQFGASGEPCVGCGAPLASDQRYCLECGRRRATARVPYAELLAGRRPEEVLGGGAPAAAPPPPRRPWAGAAAAVGPAGTAVVLALGILIGVLVSDEPDQQPVQRVTIPAPQKPPIINVNAGGGSTDAAVTEFAGDWPEGKNGFTVRLQTLPKDSTQAPAVAAAKSAAQGKGATDVGALDSDLYPSLTPGDYVVYSGVFAGKGGKAKAKAALRKLKVDFPAGRVVEVKAEGEALEAKGERPEEKEQTVEKDTLKELERSSGAEQQKKSAKLPDTLKLPGKPPPADKQKAGGGTEEQVIE